MEGIFASNRTCESTLRFVGTPPKPLESGLHCACVHFTTPSKTCGRFQPPRSAGAGSIQDLDFEATQAATAAMESEDFAVDTEPGAVDRTVDKGPAVRAG